LDEKENMRDSLLFPIIYSRKTAIIQIILPHIVVHCPT
jgi:hypothetical protein